MIQIRCDIEAFKKVFTDAEKEQIPFAVSQAVNDVALAGQDMLRQKESANFVIRRPWVLQESVKISHFSTKREDPIHARIQVGDKADFMNKFEPGGVKTSRTGHNIAVPIMARPGKAGLVPANLRPKNLHLHSVGRAIRGDQRTFIMTTRSGRQGIFQRTGSGSRDYILLYWLTPRVPIPANLQFEQTMTDAVARYWVSSFEERFAAAMATAR